MGGLSKKAYQMSSLADKNRPPAILLDAGNLLFKQPTVAHSQELLAAEGIMEIYQQMAYDAVAVGPNDLAAGLEFLKNSQPLYFPWLSANLTDQRHKPIFPAAKIIERGAIKIGIIGLTGQIVQPSQEFIIADWRKVLPDQLTRLTKECQLVIVLSSLTGEDNGELTRQFPQVQVLITADRQQGNIVPRIDGSSLVTQTSSQGKYLGVLNLDFHPGGSWGQDPAQADETNPGKEPAHLLSRFAGEFIGLVKNLPEDPQIAARIGGVKQKIYAYNQEAASPGKQGQDAAANKFFSSLAGSARCQECHPRQAQFWSATRHAGAYATLQRQQQNFNLDCLPCHTTQNVVSGKGEVSAVSSLLNLPLALQSVGCESCHGAGQVHADSPDKVKPQGKVEEKICVVCHSKERDPVFDFQQKNPKVRCPAR